MVQLTTEQVKEKINSGEDFILDLYATWCGPCKMMLANLERVNESITSDSSLPQNYNIYKLDIDSGDRDFIINDLKIRSVPTIKIFKEGKEVFSRVGVMSPTELINSISTI